MKKKLFFIIPISIFVAIFIFLFMRYLANDTNISKEIKYDEYLPTNVEYIDSTKSENFSYDMVVKLNKKKEKTGFYTVLHNLKISKKQQSVFNNIKVTVYLDESMREIILPHTVLKFGTAVDDKIDIIKDSKGIETARITSITDSLGFDENIRRLSKDIKVQVIWDGGEEYVNIPHSAINLEIINK